MNSLVRNSAGDRRATLKGDANSAGDRRATLKGDANSAGDRRATLKGNGKSAGDRRATLKGNANSAGDRRATLKGNANSAGDRRATLKGDANSAGDRRATLAAWAGGMLLLGVGGVASLTTGQLRQAQAQEERGKLTSARPASPSGSTLPNSTAASSPLGGASASELLREGAKIVDQPAVCRSSGDRLQITLGEATVPIIALENLASQRILKATLDDAGDERWLVNGQITEFQGRNFILLDRVMRQPKRLD